MPSTYCPLARTRRLRGVMTHAIEELRLLARTLFEGEQRNGEVCPFCRGGRTGEKSLRITRLPSGTCLYICGRASCGRKGRLEGTTGAGGFALHDAPTDRKPRDFEPRIFRGTLEEVPDVIREYYISKYGFREKDFRETSCRWSPEYNRTAWEVRSPIGAVRGYELRSHRDEDRPKTLHYRHSPDAWVGWVGVDKGAQREFVVVVEDIISAHKVAGAGFTAASIMGSNVSLDVLIDLMRVTENVVLCLDKDATDKAIKTVNRFGFLAPGMVCLPIERDLKYETHERIIEIINHA